MQIWVDADACPQVIKEILFRAADRVRVQLILVANKKLRTPGSQYIRAIQVKSGFDEADKYIVENIHSEDLVITADIPLASEVIAKGGHALNPRGTLYTRDNISNYLVTRDLLDQLRGSGVVTGGPPAFSQSERMAFANQLDRFLTQHCQ
jgi:uncharacterized protein